MKIIAYKCPQCGANLEIEQGRKEVFCSFCGTKLFIDDETRTMRIENNININKTIRYTDEAQISKEQGRTKVEAIKQRGKTLITIVSILAALIMGMFSLFLILGFLFI